MCARRCEVREADCVAAGGEVNYDEDGCCKCMKESIGSTAALGEFVINDVIPLFLSSCCEKATKALYMERIQTRLGVALVSEFSVEFCF